MSGVNIQATLYIPCVLVADRFMAFPWGCPAHQALLTAMGPLTRAENAVTFYDDHLTPLVLILESRQGRNWNLQMTACWKVFGCFFTSPSCLRSDILWLALEKHLSWRSRVSSKKGCSLPPLQVFSALWTALPVPGNVGHLIGHLSLQLTLWPEVS